MQNGNIPQAWEATLNRTFGTENWRDAFYEEVEYNLLTRVSRGCDLCYAATMSKRLALMGPSNENQHPRHGYREDPSLGG